MPIYSCLSDTKLGRGLCTVHAWLPSLSATHPLHWDHGKEAFNSICPINNQKAPTKNTEIVRWYQVTHHCPVKTTLSALSACFSSMLHQGLAALSSRFWQCGKPTQISHPRDKSGRREKAKFLPQEDGCSIWHKTKMIWSGGKTAIRKNTSCSACQIIPLPQHGGAGEQEQNFAGGGKGFDPEPGWLALGASYTALSVILDQLSEWLCCLWGDRSLR